MEAEEEVLPGERAFSPSSNSKASKYSSGHEAQFNRFLFSSVHLFSSAFLPGTNTYELQDQRRRLHTWKDKTQTTSTKVTLGQTAKVRAIPEEVSEAVQAVWVPP